VTQSVWVTAWTGSKPSREVRQQEESTTGRFVVIAQPLFCQGGGPITGVPSRLRRSRSPNWRHGFESPTRTGALRVALETWFRRAALLNAVTGAVSTLPFSAVQGAQATRSINGERLFPARRFGRPNGLLARLRGRFRAVHGPAARSKAAERAQCALNLLRVSGLPG
jgi:hypothetical protein